MRDHAMTGSLTGHGIAAATPLKTVTMTPSTQTQGVRVDVEVVYLDDIPGAMDSMGWHMSARLMRRWFATKPAWAMPQEWRKGEGINYLKLLPSQVDDQIVKMKWALGFDRVVSTFEDLCQNWNSPEGLKQLKIRLEAAGWNSGTAFRLGSGLRTAKELDLTCQVNRRPVGASIDTLDDFYGAVFRATPKLALVGKASRSLFSKRDLFEIEKIGVYLRDTYDFNADWFDDAVFGLGVWSKKRVLSKKETITYKATPFPLLARTFPGFVPARNEDFRRWQSLRNEGSDFFVFSDVMWLPPNVEHVYF
jgi:hypothetical protein